jgi:2-hydroxy-3-keto-5-methylthiopentenyl-1-phosphate phosphatase
MLPVRSVLVDFDGTACLHDVAEHLLERFGHPWWSDYDDAEIRGEIGSREALAAQSGMLIAPQDR